MVRQLYFTADTHFNHAYMLGCYPWRGRTIAEMNETLIANWNARVLNEGDDVWVLGDFGFHAPTREGTADLVEVFWKLRGRKHLVVGNHDQKNPQVLRLPWESLETLCEIKQPNGKATLCHYPLESWPSMWRGTLHLHGHCHGSLKRKVAKRFDVGVDTQLGSGSPILWDDLVELASKETFVPTDGHGTNAL